MHQNIQNDRKMIRLDLIQNSNKHVQRIINNVKHLIETQDTSKQQKQKLYRIIRLENDQLNNCYFRINCQKAYIEINNDKKQKLPFQSNYQIYKKLQKYNQNTSINDLKDSDTKRKQKHYNYFNSINSDYQNKILQSKQKCRYDTLNSYDREKSFFQSPTWINSQCQNSRNQLEESRNKIKNNIISNSDQRHIKTGQFNFNLNSPKSKQKQTNYKSIIQKNKQKLFSAQSKKYKIHIQQLQRKKSKKKNTLSLSPNSKNFKSIQRLHSSRLTKDNCHKCLKEQNKCFPEAQAKQKLKSFHLVKKYLTQKGQQQCYNFLRSRCLPEQSWGSYITQYVYKQLSKSYTNLNKRSNKSNK